MPNWIDLHMHSCFSPDGHYSPEELAALCVKAGIRVAALCDHNSTAGVGRMTQAAQAVGVQLIPCVELDCQLHGLLLHILGYGIDFCDPIWASHEAATRATECASSAQLLQNVHNLGVAFDDALVYSMAGDGPVEAIMIAECALANPCNDANPLLAPYRPGGIRSDNPLLHFYWDLCAPDKPAHVHISYIDLVCAVEMIKASGGVPILAHPGQNLGCNEALLQQILATGVQGIETDCSYHDAQTAAFYRHKVTELGLLRTIGSDFHGKSKPLVLLGNPDCDGQAELYQALADAMALATARHSC